MYKHALNTIIGQYLTTPSLGSSKTFNYSALGYRRLVGIGMTESPKESTFIPAILVFYTVCLEL